MAGFNGPMQRPSSSHLNVQSRQDGRVQLWHHRDMDARRKELKARAASRNERALAMLRAVQERDRSDAELAERRSQICRDMQRLWAKPQAPRTTLSHKDHRIVSSMLPHAAPELPEIEDIGSPKHARRSPKKMETFTPVLNEPFLEAQADAVLEAQESNLEAAAQHRASLNNHQLQLNEEQRLRKQRHAATMARLRGELDDERCKVRWTS